MSVMERAKLKATLAVLGMCAALAAPARADDDPKELRERAVNAARSLGELLAAEDSAVPEKLLESAHCIAVIPKLVKGAFVVGGRHGEGLVSCRTAGGWSRPAFVGVSGGSVGLQIGVEATDMVLFFTNRKAIDRLDSDNVTFGGNASVAAGPFGRSAEAGTDYKLDSEIYVYARSKGAFAGIAIEGGELGIDEDSNALVYGAPSARELLASGGDAPEIVRPFVAALERLAPVRAAGQM
jgi:lipid-binding SYLF domain-containing protein